MEISENRTSENIWTYKINTYEAMKNWGWFFFLAQTLTLRWYRVLYMWMCAHKTYISLWVQNGSKVFDVLIQLITKSMDNLTRSSVCPNTKHILGEQFFPFPSNCAHPTIISYLVVSIVFISRLLVYNIAYYYYITT